MTLAAYPAANAAAAPDSPEICPSGYISNDVTTKAPRGINVAEAASLRATKSWDKTIEP